MIAIAHVHLRKPGWTCEFVTDFFDGVDMSNGAQQRTLGLSHVNVHSDLAKLFLFCDDHISNPWGVFLWFDIFNFVGFPELLQMSTQFFSICERNGVVWSHDWWHRGVDVEINFFIF